MEGYTNKHGRECYRNVSEDSPFSSSCFHEVEAFGDDQQVAFHSNLGSITVLDRMTGFGWRDIETGYRAPDGTFWLASGNFDVRQSGCQTVGDAIEWIKRHANNCIAVAAK